MSMFRYPLVTYLTSKTFNALGMAMAEGKKSVDKSAKDLQI